MKSSPFKLWGVILHSIPSLIAIGILEIVNVQVYIYGPISQGPLLILGWLTLQMVPGFLFGYISDQHYRKKALIISQLLGVVGGVVLAIFGFETWVLVLIALVFNPMPVARAAFLDNFPQHSMLKLIAITFLAQQIPWIFFNFISKFPYESVVFWTLIALTANIFFTIFFFRDTYDKSPRKKHTRFVAKKYKLPLILTLGAFVLAETTFYLLWSHLETNISLQSWQSVTTLGTVLGIFIAMLYNRLPHISVITLFYSIGAAMMLAVFLHCFASDTFCNNSFVNTMSHYSVIGGIYLPFVTLAVIDILGPKHKALGSALIEFGDTAAAFIAPIIGIVIQEQVNYIVLITGILYILAAWLQKSSEKKLSVIN